VRRQMAKAGHQRTGQKTPQERRHGLLSGKARDLAG
jgi:hypothetical protein